MTYKELERTPHRNIALKVKDRNLPQYPNAGVVVDDKEYVTVTDKGAWEEERRKEGKPISSVKDSLADPIVEKPKEAKEEGGETNGESSGGENPGTESSESRPEEKQ